MYKLFKNLAILCSILLILSSGLLLAYSWLNAKQINGIAAKTLILGDSQTQNGLDPAYMKPGTINYSNSAEPFYIVKQKLRVLSKKSTPFKLIIPVSVLNLRSELEKNWINNDTVFTEKSSLYFGAIELPRPEGVHNDLKSQLQRLQKLVYRSIYTLERKYLLRQESPLGGFNPNSGQFDLSKKCPTSPQIFKPSKLQIKELYAIQNYCVQNGIQLILVSMPKYCSTMLELEKVFKRHTSTKYIDCHDWYIGRADCFADFNHLNVKGSKLFSRRLDAIISKK
jgi:hypothetical protein